jgi:hypothetical protein
MYKLYMNIKKQLQMGITEIQQSFQYTIREIKLHFHICCMSFKITQRLPVCSVLRCPDVITLQREFRARFKKDAPHKNNAFFKPCTELTLHCNNKSGHLKTEHTGSLFLLRRHLGNWSRGPAVSMRRDPLVAYGT